MLFRSNNGYKVVNIGIKQSINQIIDAANEANVDAIGMSGLLVKSTMIMKENLEELSARGLSKNGQFYWEVPHLLALMSNKIWPLNLMAKLDMPEMLLKV